MFCTSPVEQKTALTAMKSHTGMLILEVASDVILGSEVFWEFQTEFTFEVVPLQNIIQQCLSMLSTFDSTYRYFARGNLIA